MSKAYVGIYDVGNFSLDLCTELKISSTVEILRLSDYNGFAALLPA